MPTESDIRLNSDRTLTDHDIGPEYNIGSITDFHGSCDGFMWRVPTSDRAPRLYTAANLRQIAQIIDDAGSAAGISTKES